MTTAGAAFGVSATQNFGNAEDFTQTLPLFQAKCRRTGRRATFLTDVDAEVQKPTPMARVPSFSIEDRRQREVVGETVLYSLFRSDLVVSLVYTAVFVIPHVTQNDLGPPLIWLGIFISWHLVVTMSKSIPDETLSIEELNMRTNASTFVAMVLYPAIGVWSCQKFVQIENFVTFQKEGKFLWGTIFPVFMWGMSALVLMRESYSPVSVDNSAVVSNDEGGASLGLFRRYPTTLERFNGVISRAMTMSLWHILPAAIRPAGGAGRFCFQMVGPVVVLFLYIGLRFILFAAQNIHHQLQCYPFTCIEDFENTDIELAGATFVIWIYFTTYCVVIRGVVTSSLFLRITVRDLQTRQWLSPRWPLVSVESKRQRVLWAFRGLAGAFVPHYYVLNKCIDVKGGVCQVMHKQPSGDALDYFLWYLYFGVYVSFLMEGVGALFFALHEAERGCHLKTPFLFFMKEAFWLSYNAFLQPLGTVVNVVFGLLNGEFLTKLKLRELFGPLLNERGEFRDWLWKKRVTASVLTDDEFDEWVATWKRKRESVGKSTDSLDILKPDKPPTSSAPTVFQGDVFPRFHERNDMMDHHTSYISLKPWELHDSDEKFQKWHGAYREEVMSFLSEPYNFTKLREVWVFGYGSLMSPDSPAAGLSERQRKLFLPYWMKKEAGFQRCWNYRHGSVGINAVGLRKVPEDKADYICGIAYPMDYEFASDLYSKREDGYRLLLVKEELMEPMHPDYRIPKGAGYIWVCGEPILKCEGPENYECANYKCKRHWPTDDSPILQSYVDEIIAGCLKYKTKRGMNDGMNFAAAVIRSIHGWERPWFNDRLLAGRPWKYSPEYELTDGILNTCPTSHRGFVKRLQPSLGVSPVLGRLYESAFIQSEDWRVQFYGTAEAHEDDTQTTTKLAVAANTADAPIAPNRSARLDHVAVLDQGKEQPDNLDERMAQMEKSMRLLRGEFLQLQPHLQEHTW